jgi:6-phosphogluconolactonase
MFAILPLLLSGPIGAPNAPAHQATRSTPVIYAYIGSYTHKGAKGIGIYRFDADSGSLTHIGDAAGLVNPSFLAIHPNGRYLYAVSEAGSPGGSVIAFQIDRATGNLTQRNVQPSGGTYPCHIAVHPSGKLAAVANYGNGTVTTLPIGAEGMLGEPASVIQHAGTGPNKQRQEGPHAHSANFDSTGSRLFVADLGIDRVMVYRVDAATARIAPNDPPSAAVAPGAGPRHLAQHPNGRFVYVINELASTITAFAYDARTGALREIETVSTLPADFKGSTTTAEVVIHPNGRFLYGSNRGHDSLAIFRVDGRSGRLTPLGHQSTLGKTPRNFAIAPGGRFLVAANQDSDSLVVFRINQNSGALTPVGSPVTTSMPVCVRFLEVR